MVASWGRPWTHIIPFFAFPPDVRRVLYTTNALESVRAQLRKIIKTGGHFLHDDAADKLIWLALRMSQQNGNGAAVLEIRDEPIRDSVRRSLHPADRGMMHGAMFFSVARSPVDGTFHCGVDANRREPKA